MPISPSAAEKKQYGSYFYKNITSTVLSQVKKNAFKNIKTGAVINVINKKARLAVKAAIPSNITVNQM